MSDIKLIAVADNNDKSISVCGGRLRIESRSGNREIAVFKGQVIGIDVNDWDKIICVYGAVKIGLMFKKQRNGVSVILSLIPNQSERKEITISTYLLEELLRESRSNSPSAPKIDYSGVDLSQMTGVFAR